jgi:hypothetical protein
MKQNRITLKRLKVAEFASQETLCFAADVYFDGHLTARAHNDGQGGMTFVEHVNLGWFHAAIAFVATLPAEVTDMPDPKDPSGFFTWKRKLEDVVDTIASEMQDEKRIRAAFNRSMKKVAFVLNDSKGIPRLYTSTSKLPTDSMAHRERVINSFVVKNPKAVILNRLSEPEAFELFKQVAVQ